jgi:hypothetical protein
MPRSWFRVVACAALLMATSLAHGGESLDERVAQELFEEGAKHYDAGEYTEAIVEFDAARRVKAIPALDYNIARCHDHLGHVGEAIRSYHAYLASNPPPDEDGGARKRVAELEAGKRDPVPRRTAGDVRRARAAIAVSSTFAGLALGSLAIGLGLYVDSGHEFDLLRARGCGTAFDCGPSRWNDFRQQERAGIGLLAVGGALVALDVALWAGWARREIKRARPVTLVENGAALANPRVRQ